MSDLDKLMKKLKKDKKVEKKPTKEVEEKPEDFEDDNEDDEETQEEEDDEETKPQKEDEDLGKTNEEIGNEIMLLQNDGVFRRELLALYKERNDYLNIIARTLLDIRNKLIGEEKDGKKSKKS